MTKRLRPWPAVALAAVLVPAGPAAGQSDLVDLSLIGKQAHWTVVGPQFRSIHLALDELVAVARDFADQAAERLTAIGVAPDGRAATVARESGTKGFGNDWTKGEEVVAAIVAMTDVRLLVVDRLHFWRLLSETPDLVRRMLVVLSRRVRRLEQATYAMSHRMNQT